MNRLIELSIKKYFQLRKLRVSMWKKSQVATQEYILQELVSEALSTEFGVTHSFELIDSYEKYKVQVPVSKHEDLLPYIERMMKKESHVLWTGVIDMFSKSSGTTSSVSKYIPVTQESLKENNYKAGRDLYAIALQLYPDLHIFKDNGAVLGITGSFEERSDDIKVGDVSALIANELPSMFQERRKPSLDIALLKNWDKKIQGIIDECVNENITHLSGVPTWFIPMFNELKKQHPYETLRDIWPNLQLFIHGAVSFEPYKETFNNLLPFDDMKYLEVYNASEGFFAVQDTKNPNDGMLLLTDHGVFYEFIPFDQYQNGNKEALWLKEVKLNTPYALIITTNAGLYRYDIGDVIEFTSVDPYRIKIVGRTKTCLNLCGEELMEGNTDTAIALLNDEYGLDIQHYTVTATPLDSQKLAQHMWIIESNTDTDEKEIAQKLDTILRSLNSDYNAKREGDMALTQLKVTVVKKGSFMNWLSSKEKLGGQHKIPKLNANQTIYHEVLEKAEK